MRISHRATALLAIAFWLTMTAAAGAQTCTSLAPSNDLSGRTDWTNITNCLNGASHRATLAAGHFYIDRPVNFPRNITGTVLDGAGNSDSGSVLEPVYTCGAACPDPNNCFVSGGSYQPVINAFKAPGARLSNFKLSLVNLRRSCGFFGSFGIQVHTANTSTVTGVRIAGSAFTDPGFTTGGANTGGLNVVNSRSCTVTNNVISDVDFMFENGGVSAGHSGIRLDNSAGALVQGNTVRRSSFGIEVSNKGTSMGYSGDGSGTQILSNTIIGAANINCPNCSQGRAIKLQACGDATILPLRNLIVRFNNATEFGGFGTSQGGSGLDLVCGVQFSTFENNTITGGPTAEFGLQIRGITDQPKNQNHHNTLNANSFRSGRGQAGCNSQCYDVNFFDVGPDQIGIRRRFAGSNTYSTLRDGGTDRGCGDYAHAFYNYPAGQTFINRGQSLLLAAAGVRPSARVTFRFVRSTDSVQVTSYTSQNANGNCVMNQELLTISSGIFTPGLYKVYADYGDGNSNAAIADDPIGTLDVR